MKSTLLRAVPRVLTRGCIGGYPFVALSGAKRGTLRKGFARSEACDDDTGVSPRSFTFASFAFGCRVNQAEKEMLDSQLINKGLTYSESNPALFLINTCAVTNKAEREARQLIYQTKRKWPKSKIVVTGCAATKWIKEGRKIEGVDLAIDNVNKEYIAQLLSSKPNLKTKSLNNLSSDKFHNSGRYYLKIQDGCQRFCTFCIVPYLRGQPKSFGIKYLVSSIKGLGKNIKEVILTAINTQAYGFDTGEKLTDLITSILNNTKIERLSFGSIHPWSINDEFFDLYKSTLTHERLVKFFHIPLQSGSNKILSFMKRDYTREEFIEKLNILKNIHPFTFIGTDIIVGFLEESDQDFEDTYNFLRDSPICRFHVFRFSKRDKTAAFFMSKRLKEPSPQDKAKRSKALIALSRKKYQQFLALHIGKTFPALFLEQKTDGCQVALLNNQIPVLIEAPTTLRLASLTLRRSGSGNLNNALRRSVNLAEAEKCLCIPRSYDRGIPRRWVKTSNNFVGEIKKVIVAGFNKGNLTGRLE